MYKSLIINDFRQFNNMEISLGKRLTVIAGRNSTGKSTILGILANSGELKKRMELHMLMGNLEQSLVRFSMEVKDLMLQVPIEFKLISLMIRAIRLIIENSVQLGKMIMAKIDLGVIPLKVFEDGKNRS